MAKLKQVTVKGAGDDEKVVLWERNDEHPEGEAFVVNNGKSYTVAETPLVRRRMSEGLLVEGSADEVKEREAAAKETTNTAATRDTNKAPDNREVKRNN